MFYAILQFPSQPTPPPSPCYVERLYVSGALGNGKEESGVWAMKMESQLLRKNNWDTNPFPQNQPKKIAFERESHFVSMHAVLLETNSLDRELDSTYRKSKYGFCFHIFHQEKLLSNNFYSKDTCSESNKYLGVKIFHFFLSWISLLFFLPESEHKYNSVFTQQYYISHRSTLTWRDY